MAEHGWSQVMWLLSDQEFGPIGGAVTGDMYRHDFCWVPKGQDCNQMGLKLGHRAASKSTFRSEIIRPVTRSTEDHGFHHDPWCAVLPPDFSRSELKLYHMVAT